MASLFVDIGAVLVFAVAAQSFKVSRRNDSNPSFYESIGGVEHPSFYKPARDSNLSGRFFLV
jgi:hypothetical protein